MKKIIAVFVLFFIIAIAVVVYYVLSNLDALVKSAIEQYGSQATRTAVRVEQVKIDITEGSGAINGLVIANPKGFSTPNAFSLQEIRTRINIESFQEEPYVVDEITIKAPQIYVEINQDNKTNLNVLKENLMSGIPKSATQDQDGTQTTAEQSGNTEPKLIIRRVSFVNGSVQAKVVPLNNKEYQLQLPSLNMTNLGGNKGATPTELARQILNRVSDLAREEIKKQGIDQELDNIKGKAEARVEEEKARLKEKSESKLDEQKQKAKDKLEGLFGK